MSSARKMTMSGLLVAAAAKAVGLVQVEKPAQSTSRREGSLTFMQK
jgi:hypothetical protein